MQDFILLTELFIRYGLAFRLKRMRGCAPNPNIAVQPPGVVGFILNFLVMSYRQSIYTLQRAKYNAYSLLITESNQL